DVVLVNFPFASGVGSKVRPAVVVQNDANNRRLSNTIVAQITSRTQFAKTEPTQILVSVSTDAGRQTGLLRDSAVSCENIYTIRQDAIVRTIGSMSGELMESISNCLKASLALN